MSKLSLKQEMANSAVEDMYSHLDTQMDLIYNLNWTDK